ncbi:hypothetical protein FRC12_014234 [Ceratobasidium sp. 428]|nr:hypothetical protein FRC12_014234 [Ceratobasidium sp. 428]
METSGLFNHLSECKEKAKQSTLLEDYGWFGGSQWLTKPDVHKFYALWVCKNMQPFQIVKDQYLHKLLDPQACKHMPHCGTIAQDIKRIYTATQEDIIAQLAEQRGTFHIALDMFQADNGTDYMGIVLFHQEVVQGEKIGINCFMLECFS